MHDVAREGLFADLPPKSGNQFRLMQLENGEVGTLSTCVLSSGEIS